MTLRPILTFLLGLIYTSLPLPSYAQSGPDIIGSALEAIASADSEETARRAAQSITELGPSALPELTRRLAEAASEDDQINISYPLGTIIGMARFKRRDIMLPPELVPLVGRLLLTAKDPVLAGNLANLSGFIRGHGSKLGPGLIALLARADEPALRETTFAAIDFHREEMMSLIAEAFHDSDDERFSGDLARLLYDTPLDDRTIAKLKELLGSANEDAGRSAARTLQRAGVETGR